MKKTLFCLILLLVSISLSSCSGEKNKPTLEDMESYLMDQGVLEGEKTEPAAIMIGAAKGFKYLDSGIEVYMYDTGSDTFKDLVKTGSVTLEGFNIEMPVSAVNGKFVLLYDKDDDGVIKVFNDFGK